MTSFDSNAVGSSSTCVARTSVATMQVSLSITGRLFLRRTGTTRVVCWLRRHGFIRSGNARMRSSCPWTDSSTDASSLFTTSFPAGARSSLRAGIRFRRHRRRRSWLLSRKRHGGGAVSTYAAHSTSGTRRDRPMVTLAISPDAKSSYVFAREIDSRRAVSGTVSSNRSSLMTCTAVRSPTPARRLGRSGDAGLWRRSLGRGHDASMRKEWRPVLRGTRRPRRWTTSAPVPQWL